jgi:lysophospholipase L1-like esterase
VTRRTKNWVPAAVAAALALSILGGGGAPATAAPARGAAPTYLALGTSLAVGYQPGRGETPKGYVSVLLRTFQARIPDLGLRNVGCVGETTRSMLNGRNPLCDYAAGSQVQAAVAFLDSHQGQVPFITIDAGANDLLGACLRPTWRIDRRCAAEVLPRIQARLTRIVAALSAAAPGIPIVGMTYYDPLLGLWGLVPGGRALARADQRVWNDFNAALASAYTDAGAEVADVAVTFDVENFDETVVVPGRGELPVNVANACRWTWFCTPRFAGDPHANAAGYRRIARTFEPAIDALLP